MRRGTDEKERERGRGERFALASTVSLSCVWPKEKSAPKAVRVPRDHSFEKSKSARWPFTAWKSQKIDVRQTEVWTKVLD